jgi:TPR repeat protein
MKKGDINGTYCYADMLEYGKGVEQDLPRAVKLHKMAADAGHNQRWG